MKYIAALSMIIDHIGMIFYSNQIGWRILGRLAMPIFAYGIACGFIHFFFKKYTCRLFLFAGNFPNSFSTHAKVSYGKTLGLNIGFTFSNSFRMSLLFRKYERKSKE